MEECSCEECVSACKNYPGRLIPEDVKKIADFLGITPKQLIEEYLVAEYVKIDKLKRYMFAPVKTRNGRKKLAETGKAVREDYLTTKGRCVFLDSRNRCSIHGVKPFECREYMGCRNTFMGKPYKQKNADMFFATRWRKYPWESSI